MYRIITASSDTYITNKIINNSYRATDANVGQAGTLDLFKLYNESVLSSESTKASAVLVSFAAGSAGYIGSTIIFVDSNGKTVTLTGDTSNARVTEGSGTFIANTGAATAVSDNIATAFNTVKSGDTIKIDMIVQTTGGSGILTFTQSSAGADGNTIITGTALTSGNIRDKNSAISPTVSFEGGSTAVLTTNELSRLLIKFDYDQIKKMNSLGQLDVSDSSFSATLKLHDVYGGQTTPRNFKCIVFPLTKKFDEGDGYDIGKFSDLDATNYITASYSNGSVVAWQLAGAMKSGSLSDADSIDIITSGTLAGKDSPESLCFEQFFKTGEEDLSIDVTKIVSASVNDLITNNGYLIAYSGSYEKDLNTYFVKRFASRNTANTGIRPKLILKFDDAVIDNHENFVFNHTGTLYLNNQVRDVSTNVRFGDGPSDVATGANCMKLKIISGSFKKEFNVSQVPRGSSRVTGMYSSSFAISSFGSLYADVLASGSLVFDEIWSNSSETITFLSSSLTIRKSDLNKLNLHQTTYHVVTLNLADRYKPSEIARIKVFVEGKNREVVFRKTPLEKKSEVYEKMYYRVRDFISGDIIIPFDKVNNSTRLSADTDGMYFDFYMDSLPSGRSYVFDFLIDIDGYDTVISDAAAKFIVE